MRTAAASAFTLVELLVVVTIIAILLALLTPAMDRAMHEAMVAKDGSNLRTIGLGATSYATGSNRYYPWRGANWLNAEPKRIAHEGYYDDRVRFMPYFGHDVFADPFLPIKVDWGIYYNGKEPPTSAGGPPPPSPFIIWSTYTPLFGMTYKDRLAGQGMMKLGQGFTWNGETTQVMVSDMDDLWNGTFGWGSHEPTPGASYPETGRAYDHPNGWVLNRWDYPDMTNRGTLDNQVAYTDGAVGRHRDLKASNSVGNHEDRLLSIPIYPVEQPNLPTGSATWPTFATRVPLK